MRSVKAGIPGRASELFAPPEIQTHYRPDGSIVLRSRHALAAPSTWQGFAGWFAHWAKLEPQRPFLAERTAAGDLRRVSYGEAWQRALLIAGGLQARGLAPSKPVLIIAENGIDHALVMLAAMLMGQPVAPVSTAYARLGEDFARLRQILAIVQPELVFVDDAARYAKALAAVDLQGAEIVAREGGLAERSVTPLEELERRAAPAAPAAVPLAGTAKILFTSGSTGTPKGVINTHAMLAHNQESIAAIWPFIHEEPLQLVDWLPWSHTFGGNHNLGLVLRTGGFMLIDDGRPVPGLIERTAANLKEVSPTVYFNVPRGYAMLLDLLDRDEALQASFFGRLRLLFYAGASLPPTLWDRMQALSARIVGKPVPMTSSWGSTETAPLATSAHFPLQAPGNIGVPVPGVEIKLVPQGGRLEILCRGANVTPGYHLADAASAGAFDEEGWLKTGDAVRFADSTSPGQGLFFDGRIAESFKLSTGTWVNVGVLRTAVVAALAPLADDCVIVGHDRDELGLLIFPNQVALDRLTATTGQPLSDLCGHGKVIEAVADSLRIYNSTAGGSSQRIARAIVLDRPPSLDAGEITDKGYINQRAVLEGRRDIVQALFAEQQDPRVILPKP